MSCFFFSKLIFRVNWRLDRGYADNEFYHVQVYDALNPEIIPIDQNDYTRKEYTRPNFDSTRFYVFRVRTRLRNVWSNWAEQKIKIRGRTDVEIEKLEEKMEENPEISVTQIPIISSSSSGICSNISQPVNLIFVLDSSHSVSQPNFNIMLSWLRDIVIQLKIGPDAVHVGISRFAKTLRNVFFLNEFDDARSMITKINQIEYTGRGTEISRALSMLLKTQLAPENGRQDGVPTFVYFLTDGNDDDTVKVRQEAKRIQVSLFQ